ncbi:Fic family protein [uncultured Thiodictyon sp.]|jgi:Fic family protein|uniref:Fic family protein n=1 Tax=uncultured Thiodictyon sp. TaxID=1846217 RepID=UPI0025CC0E63|nr:Fic family protein [uncultured Thiodictyon sp.]
MSPYQPPLTITPEILALVEQIGETLGRWSVTTAPDLSPRLRRGNRIRTIHASLAIENNTLSLEQVTALLEGKRVLGLPREIQEVRNAFAAYDQLLGWDPESLDDLLAAHAILMGGLMDEVGRLRGGGVGIYRGAALMHMAPPASRLGTLMQNLLGWLARGELHPLVASCVFHYEFEFIHPFADGNGRLGRLWQTLILSRWRPILAYLPVETVVRDRQDAYYQSLAASDQAAESAPFVAFMLQALLRAMEEVEAG